jgi:hypothetical protein
MIRYALGAMFLIASLAPVSIGAETYAQLWQRVCPNGAQLTELGRLSDRADSLNDSNEVKRYGKLLAAALYDCSTSGRVDAYARDVTKYFSMIYVEDYSHNSDIDNLSLKFNEFGANTQFADLKKMAIAERDRCASFSSLKAKLL